jgi:hypothetical protein
LAARALCFTGVATEPHQHHSWLKPTPQSALMHQPTAANAAFRYPSA